MGKHILMKLPYEYNALEPVIDARTVEIHHDKHHQTYVDNLNKALEKYPDLLDKPIEEVLSDLASVPDETVTAVRNNGGGVYNHNIYWQTLTGDKQKQKFSGKIAEAIKRDFESFEKFKELLSDCAMKRFGSGWAWLVFDKVSGELEIYSTANQDSPISQKKIPLVAIDVWEHSYYLKYQNRRKDYVEAIFRIINWDIVNELYEKAV